MHWGAPKTVKHHLASVVHQHVCLGVTSSSLTTPRTLLSCCFWYNNSRRPGCCVTLWSHIKKTDWKWKRKKEKNLWSVLLNDTAAPTSGCRPSTLAAAPRCYRPPLHPVMWRREEITTAVHGRPERVTSCSVLCGYEWLWCHGNDETLLNFSSAFWCHSH